jgi:hypothetical protein
MTPILSAIISVLIGNFLIGLLFKPALEYLQKIREQLLSIAVPMDDVYLRSFRAKPWNAEKFEEEETAARRSINETLRKYMLAYGSFKRVAFTFLLVLLLLVNLTIVAAAFDPWKTTLLCVLMTATIVAFARMLAADSFPAPDHLWNLDYLVAHFSNFHPEALIRLLNIGVEKVSWEPKPRLCLSCAVHLTGYKFFLVMTNEDESQKYFISYGKVSAKTRVNQVVLPEHYRWLIPLGELDPNWPAGLHAPVFVHLFVFIPTPIGWSDAGSSPYFVSHELWTPHPGDPSRVGEVVGLTPCNPRSKDRNVTFKRKKTVFYETWEVPLINRDEDKAHYRLRRLLWFYRRELENATDISTLIGSQLPTF